MLPASHPHATGTGRRCSPNDVVPSRELTTIRSELVPLPDPDALTHLVLRRFASCPICNVHLHSVAGRHGEIKAAGIREVVVFHSPVEAMLPHQGELPFDAIADPDYRLYHEFGVEFSWKAVLDPRAWTAWLKPQAWRAGMREVRDPGGRWFSIRGASMRGMPAEFLIEPSGRVLAAKYGAHANDQWSVDEMLRIAAAQRRN